MNSFKTWFFSGLWGVVLVFCMMLKPGYDAHSFTLAFIFLTIGLMLKFTLLPRAESLQIPLSPFLLLFGGFWLVVFISIINSEVPFVAFVYFCFTSMLPLSFIYSSVTEDKKNEYFRNIGFIAALGFAALSIFCLVEYFYLQNWLFYGRTHYPLANSNSLGGLLSIIFFCGAGYMLATRQKAHRWIALAFCTLIFLALLTTQSRGAFISLIVFFTSFCILSRKGLKNDWGIIWLLIGLCIISFLVISFPPDFSTRHQTPMIVFNNSLEDKLPILWDRPHLWLSTWEIIKRNFWDGTGIGTFFLYYPEVRNKDFSTSGYMAHNDPLQFWSEMGIFAPIFFYATIIFVIDKTQKAWRKIGTLKKTPDDEMHRRRIQILIPVCSMAAVVLQSHIEFNFYVLPILFLLGSMLAFWLMKVEDLLPSKKFIVTKGTRLENEIVKFCLVILVACPLGLFTCFQASELLIFYAKQEVSQGDLDAFVHRINLANNISFNHNARALTLAGTVPSGILRTRTDLTSQEKLNLFTQANNMFHLSVKENPRLASTYFELSLLSEFVNANMPEVKDKIESSQMLMETAVRMDPLHANTRGRYAEVLIRDGNPQKALQVLKDGMKWPYFGQDPLQLYQKTAMVALELGDMDTHEKALRAAAGIMMQRQGQ